MKGQKVLLILLGLALLAASILIAIDNGALNGGVPAVFGGRYDFDSAVSDAKVDDRIVVVDMMASWCPPCREMDRRVWVDTGVVSWLDENAVAVQVDVDYDEKTASRFGIQAMPTIIAFDAVNGVELDRHVGYLEAVDLLAWLDLVKRSQRMSEEESRGISESDDGDGDH